jgi:hypothetical protein
VLIGPHRVWFRHRSGAERYVDAVGDGHPYPLREAHDLMHAQGYEQGWWIDRWQYIGRVLVGDPSPDPWGGKPRKVKGPPLRRRLLVLWRRARRGRLVGRRGP